MRTENLKPKVGIEMSKAAALPARNSLRGLIDLLAESQIRIDALEQSFV
jgi:hypothetical protein